MTQSVDSLSALVPLFLNAYRRRDLWAVPHRRDFEQFLASHASISPAASRLAVDELVRQRFLYIDSSGNIFLVDSAPGKAPR